MIIYEILEIQKTKINKDPLLIKQENIPTKNTNKYQKSYSNNTTRPNHNNDFKNITFEDKHNFYVHKNYLNISKNSKTNFIKIKLKKIL